MFWKQSQSVKNSLNFHQTKQHRLWNEAGLATISLFTRGYDNRLNEDVKDQTKLHVCYIRHYILVYLDFYGSHNRHLTTT